MNYTYTVHYQLCDDILNNIRENDDMHEVNIENFLKEPRRVKLALVRKLDNDGYIHRVNAQSAPFFISITVEGRQFWIDGGYKKSFEELRLKSQLVHDLLKTNISTNRSVKKNTIYQIIISGLVGVFVIISGIYQVLSYKLEANNRQNKRIENTQIDSAIKNLSRRVKTLERQITQRSHLQDSSKLK
ncbi:MAG: hypothetical protein JSU01_09005 [Bacteroidetes bacterium]|nr:hypothetical protein [Bacteroidota bacterium]